MKRVFFIVLCIIGFSASGFSQLTTYSFEEAEKLSAEKPKPYFIFIKTEWCKFCKMMEKSTFQNQEVSAILEKYFYFIVLDAETKANITFNNKTFRFIPNGVNSGIHELASELAYINGEISYPAITVLDRDYSIIGQESGFIDSESLLLLLRQFQKDSVFLK